MNNIVSNLIPKGIVIIFFITGIFISGCGSKCDDYKEEMLWCMEAYYVGPPTPTQTCFDQGLRLDVVSCTCVPVDWDMICEKLEERGKEPENVDCFFDLYLLGSSAGSTVCQ